MSDVLPTYQLPVREMTQKAFDALPFRDDAAKHDPAKVYRTRGGYPNDVFVWVPIESEDAPGEWHRAPVTIK